MSSLACNLSSGASGFWNGTYFQVWFSDEGGTPIIARHPSVSHHDPLKNVICKHDPTRWPLVPIATHFPPKWYNVLTNLTTCKCLFFCRPSFNQSYLYDLCGYNCLDGPCWIHGEPQIPRCLLYQDSTCSSLPRRADLLQIALGNLPLARARGNLLNYSYSFGCFQKSWYPQIPNHPL